jgi:hypothetical protein
MRTRVLALAALVSAALALGLFVLKARTERAAGPTAVARALERALGGKARVGRTELDWFGRQLVAHDVEIDGARGPWLRARALRVRPSLAGLLRARINTRVIELEAAALTLREGDLPDAVRAPERSGMDFSSLIARGTELHIEGSAFAVQLDHADVQLRAQDAELAFVIAADAGTFRRGAAHEALSSVQVKGVLREDALHVAELSAAAEGARATLHDAELPLPLRGQARCEVDLDVDLARLAALGWPEGAPDLAGRLHARARVELASARITGEARVWLERAQVAGRDLGERIELALRADGRAVHVSGELPGARAVWSGELREDTAALRLDALHVTGGASDLRGHAVLGRGGRLELALTGDDVALEELAPLFGSALASAGLQGRGRVELGVVGPLAALEPRVDFDVRGFAAGGLELGDASAALTVRDGGRSLHFTRASLHGEQRRVTAEALTMQLDGGLEAASAKLRIARLPLSDLFRLFGAGDDPLLSRLQGVARGSATLEYARGGEERLDLDLELEAAAVDGYPFERGVLRARFTTPDAARGLSAGSLALHALELRSGGGVLKTRGALRGGGALDLQVQLERLAIERLPWARAHFAQLAGALSGTGRLYGKRTEPRAEFELRSDALGFGAARGALRLHAELRDARDAPQSACGAEQAPAAAASTGALFRLCGEALSGRARLDLTARPGDGGALRGEVELARLDIAPFLPEQRRGARMPGELDATLRIRDGSLSAPARIDGALAVRRLAIGAGELAFASAAPFEVQVARGALSLAGAELVAPKAKLALGAEGSLVQGARLTAQGKIAAGLLAKVLPGVRDLFGDLDVRLALEPGASPRLRGRAELHEGFVRLTSGVHLRKVSGVLELDGERARAADVRAEFGGGVLRASGALSLAGLEITGYDLDLAADDIAFEPQERFEVALDAQAKLRSQPEGAPPLLEGGVRLRKLVYGRHIQLPEALIAMNREERATRARYAPARDRIRFALDFTHEAPLIIRNNLIDTEVVAEGPTRSLRLVGSDQRFGLVGELAVQRGRVLYRGDEFRITRGVIAFDDEERVVPRFDLRAVAERKKRPDANIVFLARGDREAFDLQIRCDARSSAPPPFTCDFAQDRLRCDDLDALIRLWVCRAEHALTSSP